MPSPFFRPPLQDDGSIDIVGRRRDGGLDLIVVASGHLDGSLATQRVLKAKLQSYLDTLFAPEFQAEFGPPALERTSIVVSCPQAPAPEVSDLISQLSPFFAGHGVALRCVVK
jgi:hypothetical protein